MFKLLYHNIRSIKANFSKLISSLNPETDNFEIYAFTETWFKEGYAEIYPDLTYVGQGRTDKTGGGVGFYLKKDLNFEVVHASNIFNDFCESFIIKINDVFISVIYRPGNRVD